MKDLEILTILEYLTDNRKFEQPTAQIYYKRFLDKYKIDATWTLVKWKVRYLKTCFGKAEAWRKNTGAGILEDDLMNGVNTVNGKLHKICPHYEILKDIFGSAREAEMELFDSSQNSVDFFGFEDMDEDILLQPSTSAPTENTSDLFDSHVCIQPSTSNQEQTTRQEKVSNFAEKLKKSSKDSISQLSRCQKERNETQRLKLEFDERKFQKEFEFQKQKFEEEKCLKRQELELKKLEIEKDEKLKILEL